MPTGTMQPAMKAVHRGLVVSGLMKAAYAAQQLDDDVDEALRGIMENQEKSLQLHHLMRVKRSVCAAGDRASAALRAVLSALQDAQATFSSADTSADAGSSGTVVGAGPGDTAGAGANTIASAAGTSSGGGSLHAALQWSCWVQLKGLWEAAQQQGHDIQVRVSDDEPRLQLGCKEADDLLAELRGLEEGLLDKANDMKRMVERFRSLSALPEGLAAAAEPQRKQMLGEELYPLVCQHQVGGAGQEGQAHVGMRACREGKGRDAWLSGWTCGGGGRQRAGRQGISVLHHLVWPHSSIPLAGF